MVIADERWAGWNGLAQAGIGAGIPLEQANEIARQVSRHDVLAYADTVHFTIQSWLSRLSDNDLDTIPEIEAHMTAYPAYQRSSFRAEIADLLGQPIWRLLSGPCSEHLGEMNLLKLLIEQKRRRSMYYRVTIPKGSSLPGNGHPRC